MGRNSLRLSNYRTLFWLIASCFVGLAIFVLLTLPYIDSGVLFSSDGASKKTAVPFIELHKQPFEKTRLKGILRLPVIQERILRLIPDDCVVELNLNGIAVDLSWISKDKLCDVQNGFELDLKRLHIPLAASNPIDILLINTGGSSGFQLSISSSDSLLYLLKCSLYLLCTLSFFFVSKQIYISSVSQWRAILTLLSIAVGIALRYGFIFYWHPPQYFVYSDMSSYFLRSFEFTNGIFYSKQFFQPIGYPLWMGIWLRLTGDFRLNLWFQFIFSVVTFLLCWRASIHLFKEKVGFWVLLIGALHFPFISLSGFFLSETIFTLNLALLFYLLAYWGFPLGFRRGFIIGVTVLSGFWFRGNNVFFLPLLVIWGLFLFYKNPIKRKKTLLGIYGLGGGTVLILLTTALLTLKLFGEIRLSPSAGGLNFMEGKCLWNRNIDSDGDWWHSPLFIQIGENLEKRWPVSFSNSSYFWREGWKCVIENPSVLLTSVRYIYYLFFENQLWPENETSFVMLNKWYGFFYSFLIAPGLIFGFWLIGGHPRLKCFSILLFPFSLFVCSWIFKSEIRFRVPFDTALIPISVIGWTFILQIVFCPGRGDREGLIS